MLNHSIIGALKVVFLKGFLRTRELTYWNQWNHLLMYYFHIYTHSGTQQLFILTVMKNPVSVFTTYLDT